MIFLKSHKERFSSTEEYLQLIQWQTGIILIFQANPYGSMQTTKPAVSASGISAEFTWQGGEGMAGGRGEREEQPWFSGGIVIIPLWQGILIEPVPVKLAHHCTG